MKAGLVGNWFRQLQTLIKERPPRERRVLSMLAWVIAGALFIQVAWTIESNRRSLRGQLPVLAAQADQMRHLARTWRALSATDATPSSARPEFVRQAIDGRLGELGGGIKAQWMTNGELVLKGQADFSAWVRWMAVMHQEHRLAPSRLHARHTDGGVELDATYTLPQASW
jgi:type II secretory pathway component PulM